MSWSVHRLPVIDADGRPIGMSSRADIARSATLRGKGVADSKVAQRESGSAFSERDR